MPSPFDLDAFTQTAVDLTKQDLEWHSLPDKSESLGQVTKITVENMADVIAQAPEKWRSLHMLKVTLEWDLKSDELRQEMNMDRVLARQQLLLELTGAPPPAGNGVIKWGINENQQLKDTIKAVGLADAKKFTLPMLNAQMGWCVIGNRAIDGSDRTISEVRFVRDPVAGRASWEARQTVR